MIPIKDRARRTGFPWVTVILIGLNCLVFILGLGEEDILSGYGTIPWFITHPGESQAIMTVEVVGLTDSGPYRGIEEVIVPPPRSGAYPSLLTSMFIHAGFLHLVFNMLFLWIFGDNIEDRLGRVRFLLFYLVCGIGASLIHVVFKPDSLIPMVGASGAISGVMGAYILLYPRNRVVAILPIFFLIQLVELPAYVFLGIWFLIQLVSSVGPGSGVAFLAHIGGFALGFVLVRLFDRHRPAPTVSP